jgi:hypothetical protein
MPLYLGMSFLLDKGRDNWVSGKILLKGVGKGMKRREKLRKVHIFGKFKSV